MIQTYLTASLTAYPNGNHDRLLSATGKRVRPAAGWLEAASTSIDTTPTGLDKFWLGFAIDETDVYLLRRVA